MTQHENGRPLSLSIMVLNQGQPFVTAAFAERLALLVIDEKYPHDLFVVRGSGSIADRGANWAATFDNALVGPQDKSELALLNGRIIPKRLTITIRKTNGEIVSIT